MTTEQDVHDAIDRFNQTALRIKGERDALRAINAELLEALKLAAAYVEKTHAVIAAAAGQHNVVEPDLLKVRAAITKAEGKQP